VRQDGAPNRQEEATVALDGSARAVLLTVFGDVVRPSGGTAWLGAVSALMDELGVAPATTRQALRRLTRQEMLTTRRHGRRAAYAVTDAGRARLDEAAERIYRRESRPWDGQWRLLTWTFEEEHRAARDALRRELGWLGYGSLGTSSYCCPWDRERLEAALDKHGAHGSVDTFTAAYHGDDASLAARAYDLGALRALHAEFLRRFSPWRAQRVEHLLPRQQLARRVELVHEWRRTLFLDPRLDARHLPQDWT
jgi:phenylacetic acid degradation operon negative regulatory protein